MRDIKFRGKRLDNNEWVYGSLLQSEIDVNQLAVKCQIHERFAFDFSIKHYDVDPKTVGQFTSLQDKNGKEIYEGDLVKIFHRFDEEDYKEDFETVGKVDFSSGAFWITGDGYSILQHFHYNSSDREVVDNIYENAELIK